MIRLLFWTWRHERRLLAQFLYALHGAHGTGHQQELDQALTDFSYQEIRFIQTCRENVAARAEPPHEGWPFDKRSERS